MEFRSSSSINGALNSYATDISKSEFLTGGWLWKQAENGRWQKRYFCLLKNELVYHKSSSEAMGPERRTIPLGIVSKVEAAKGVEHGFLIHTSERTYSVYAKTQPETDNWIKLIRQELGKRSYALATQLYQNRRESELDKVGPTPRVANGKDLNAHDSRAGTFGTYLPSLPNFVDESQPKVEYFPEPEKLPSPPQTVIAPAFPKSPRNTSGPVSPASSGTLSPTTNFPKPNTAILRSATLPPNAGKGGNTIYDTVSTPVATPAVTTPATTAAAPPPATTHKVVTATLGRKAVVYDVGSILNNNNSANDYLITEPLKRTATAPSSEMAAAKSNSKERRRPSRLELEDNTTSTIKLSSKPRQRTGSDIELVFTSKSEQDSPKKSAETPRVHSRGGSNPESRSRKASSTLQESNTAPDFSFLDSTLEELMQTMNMDSTTTTLERPSKQSSSHHRSSSASEHSPKLSARRMTATSVASDRFADLASDSGRLSARSRTKSTESINNGLVSKHASSAESLQNATTGTASARPRFKVDTLPPSRRSSGTTSATTPLQSETFVNTSAVLDQLTESLRREAELKTALAEARVLAAEEQSRRITAEATIVQLTSRIRYLEVVVATSIELSPGDLTPSAVAMLRRATSQMQVGEDLPPQQPDKDSSYSVGQVQAGLRFGTLCEQVVRLANEVPNRLQDKTSTIKLVAKLIEVTHDVRKLAEQRQTELRGAELSTLQSKFNTFAEAVGDLVPATRTFRSNDDPTTLLLSLSLISQRTPALVQAYGVVS